MDKLLTQGGIKPEIDEKNEVEMLRYYYILKVQAHTKEIKAKDETILQLETFNAELSEELVKCQHELRKSGDMEDTPERGEGDEKRGHHESYGSYHEFKEAHSDSRISKALMKSSLTTKVETLMTDLAEINKHRGLRILEEVLWRWEQCQMVHRISRWMINSQSSKFTREIHQVEKEIHQVEILDEILEDTVAELGDEVNEQEREIIELKAALEQERLDCEKAMFDLGILTAALNLTVTVH